MIPLRPELFEFAEPQSVCRLSCTCKTLRSDVRDAKPWGLLAQAQLPPPKPRDEADALARVRLHVRRRLLASASPLTRRVLEGVTLQEAIAREMPTPVAFTPDRFSDFTFFLRLTDGERLIFEGDLRDLSRESDQHGLVLHLSLRHANLQWPGQADKVALVVIRDADQAMFSLGQYELDRSRSELDGGDGEQQYNFSPRGALFSSARSRLELWGGLCVTQDGYVNRLELALHHLINGPQLDDRPQAELYDIERCDEDLFQLVLSYLAGVPHLARAFALAGMESWFVEAEQPAGWLRAERLAALAMRLAELETEIEQAEEDENYEGVDDLTEEEEGLHAELERLRILPVGIGEEDALLYGAGLIDSSGQRVVQE